MKIRYLFWANLGQAIYRLRVHLKQLNNLADRNANKYWQQDMY